MHIRLSPLDHSVFLLRLLRLFKIMAGMAHTLLNLWNLIRLQKLSKFLQRTSLLCLFLISPVIYSACPDLTPYYQGNNTDWSALEQNLLVLMPECLESSEYFALLGDAQINNGDIAESLETLERALLLEPTNGAAQIDYAQALFLQGQLFAALELNSLLLLREDLPATAKPLLQQRQQTWQALTRQSSILFDVMAGYDNNLNSAPDPSQITLTLSGEPILLTLDSKFRPVSGPYLNLRLAGRYRQLAPQHQHNWLAQVRSRVSEDSQSDTIQLDTRYAFVRPDRRHSYQLNAGISHLLFGGSPLYTAVETTARYSPDSSLRCKPYYDLALQYQLFHDNSRLNGVEGKASSGFNCPFDSSWGRQQLSFELGLLENTAVKAGRLGGNRSGYQLNLNWQLPVPTGQIISQLSHTRLIDRDGYNPLLANGAERWIERSYLLIQYRRQLSSRSAFVINLFHQNQRSNIELFQSIDTTAEIGISLAL